MPLCGISSTRDSHQWWISRGKPLCCGAPFAPYYVNGSVQAIHHRGGPLAKFLPPGADQSNHYPPKNSRQLVGAPSTIIFRGGTPVGTPPSLSLSTSGQGGVMGIPDLPPSPTSHDARKVGLPGGRQLPQWPTPGSGAGGLWRLQHLCPRLHSHTAGCGGGGNGGGPPLPLTYHAVREVHGPLAFTPLRRLWVLAGDGDLPPIWVSVARGKGSTECLAALNHTLIMGFPSCRQLFGGR